jgi:hypothetical protein
MAPARGPRPKLRALPLGYPRVVSDDESLSSGGKNPTANRSAGMRQLNCAYTQMVNRCHKRDGHVFQGRFKAILVDDAIAKIGRSCHIYMLVCSMLP